MTIMYRVEKQSYSRGAWRVLDAGTGEQVYRSEMFDHPNMGLIDLRGPVCFDRKLDAVAWVCAQEAADLIAAVACTEKETA